MKNQPIPATADEIKQGEMFRRWPMDFPANAFGCFTGDCPHDTQKECDEAPELKEWIAEFAPYQVDEEVKLLEEWRFIISADGIVTHMQYKDGVTRSMVDDLKITDLSTLIFGGLITLNHEDTGKVDIAAGSLVSPSGSLTDWQPADTMPPEFSRYDAVVLSVDCKQLGKLSNEDWIKEGYTFPDLEWKENADLTPFIKHQWNRDHPNHPYDPDLWTFGAKFEIVKRKVQG